MLSSGAVNPTPLPPYSLLIFRLIALAPYDIAAQVWRIIIVLATLITIFAIARLTRVHAAVACAVVMPMALRTTVPSGQPYPIVLAFLVLAALALDRQRDRLAGALLSVAMFEPNLGLPACIAAFLFRPRCRLSLIAGAAVLVAACFAGGSWDLTVQFATVILPAQAASEVHWIMQYSLTHVLATLGTPDRLALSIGSSSYFFMVIIGITLARRWIGRGFTPSALALFPPSAAALGGAYIHVWQFGVAALAAVLVAVTVKGPVRSVAVLSAALLAIPWNEIGFDGCALLAVPSIFTIISLLGAAKPFASVAAAMTVVAVFVLVRNVQPTIDIPSGLVITSQPQEIGQKPWVLYQQAVRIPHREIALFMEIPSWCGDVLLLMSIAWAVGPVAQLRRLRTK